MKRSFLALLGIPFVSVVLYLEGPAIQAAASLDEDEIDTMQYMREEEKLARDVYRVMYAEWGKTIFVNISTSEQSHTDAVAGLIEKYGIEDPVTDDSTGVFVNQILQALYNDLVVRGAVSLEDGLRVGAFIEETDMLDLQHAIDESDNKDVDKVYENLLRGSRNHLRAYVGALEAMGVVYEAQVLTQEEVDAIVNSPMERG